VAAVMTALAMWRLSWLYLGRQREVVKEEVVVDVVTGVTQCHTLD